MEKIDINELYPTIEKLMIFKDSDENNPAHLISKIPKDMVLALPFLIKLTNHSDFDVRYFAGTYFDDLAEAIKEDVQYKNNKFDEGKLAFIKCFLPEIIDCLITAEAKEKYANQESYLKLSVINLLKLFPDESIKLLLEKSIAPPLLKMYCLSLCKEIIPDLKSYLKSHWNDIFNDLLSEE
ncbi:MAG: hypothetical protein OEZ13_04380 [Spirochaetia bacterium]|nr:hypothetical protein [Spirochaetia bacterium]